MECPHCHQALPVQTCPGCGGECLQGSLYCCKCGSALKVEPKKEPVIETDDISARTLCSDGNCIGVINEKGVCNICGKPYTGDPT